MPGCTLFLCWPDLEDAAAIAPEVTASLVALVSRRQLSACFSRLNTYAWIGDGSASGGALFGRWGFSVCDGEPTLEDLRPLLGAAQSPQHLVLAMSEQRAAPFVEAARAAGVTCEVWTNGPAGALSDGTPLSPIWQALPLATAQPVGLYVGAVALEQFAATHLPQETMVPGPDSFLQAADRLLGRAMLVGSLTQARFFTGSPEEPVVDVAGLSRGAALARLRSVAASLSRGDATERLHQDLQEELQAPCSPQTLLVVSDDPGVLELGATSRARRRRLVLWLPQGQSAPRSVRASVDACTTLADVLDFPRIVGDAAGSAARSQAARPNEGASRSPKSTNGHTAEPLFAFPVNMPAPEMVPESAIGRLTPTTKVAYLVECLRRKQGEAAVPETRVLDVLESRSDVKEGHAAAREILDAAFAAGVVFRETRGYSSSGACFLRDNPEHPVARTAVEIPDRCLRLLHQMLQKMPWVSFKLLRSVLLRDQWLGGPPYRLEEEPVDEWVNFLIQDGAIQMAKERNLVNPEYPVTALRLNPDHPLASAVILEADGTARLAPQRAILAVDHFLTRNRKPWMSIGTLRRSLESLGREELQAVLHQLQEDGAVIAQSYPNPQKEHPTTGCRLGAQTPLVQATLERRDALVQIVDDCAGVAGGRVSLAEVDAAVRQALPGQTSAEERLGWYQLLRSEGVLEFSPDLPLTADSLAAVRCGLVIDAVTRQALARGEPSRPQGFECEHREWRRPLPVEV